MRNLLATCTVAMERIRDISKRAAQPPLAVADITRPLCNIAKALAWGSFAGLYVAVLIFVGESWIKTPSWPAILAIGGLATGLVVAQVVAQVRGRSIAWPQTNMRKVKRNKLQTVATALVVGIVIHYSAIIIGVSSAIVFWIENGDKWAIVAVLIQQAVLTGGAWLMFGDHLQKWMPPKQFNQMAEMRTKGKKTPVIPVLLVLLVVVTTVLAETSDTKRVNRRRRK